MIIRYVLVARSSLHGLHLLICTTADITSLNWTCLVGVGHWLVAFRQAEEQKCRNVHQRTKETLRKCENDRGAFTPRGHTLDGPFLVRR